MEDEKAGDEDLVAEVGPVLVDLSAICRRKKLDSPPEGGL